MLNSTIQSIIQEIPANHVFDAHYVIENLAARYEQEYNAAFQSYKTINTFHSHISQTIESFTAPAKGALITRIDNSWSRNINLGDSPCACWKKN